MWPWEREQRMGTSEKDNEANRVKQATWRSRHAAENRERVRESLENNPGYLQEWRKENPDKVKEYSQRQNDTEERRAYMREYMREYRKKKASANPTPKKKGGRPRKGA